MMDESPLIEDPQVLDAKLREILVAGPLYRVFAYTGELCHFNNGASRFGQLPKQLKMYCDGEKCRAATWWDVDRQDHYFSWTGIQQRCYKCRNCDDSIQHYQILWHELEDLNVFLKVGQWPPLSIEPSPELANSLGAENAGLYKKGLIEFNFGHGIGSVAYFRRVLENKINALLDLIVEAARNANISEQQIAEIEAVKKSHRVEDRIYIASKILLSYLKPGGHNPLDKLYAPLSAGLHGESDDECLTIFSDARFVFEYLFKNLTETNKEAREYVLRLSAHYKTERKA